MEVKHSVILWIAVSWEVTAGVHLTGDEDVLCHWVGDLDGVLSVPGHKWHQLVLVWLVHGSRDVHEIFQECVIFHPESAIVLLLESADLGFQSVSPVGIIVPPWALVLLRGPWVPDLDEVLGISFILDCFDVEQAVGVAGDQSVYTSVEAASTSHWVVLRGPVFVNCF